MSFLKPVFSSARGRYQSNVLPISLSNQNTVTHLFPSTFTVRAFMIPQKALWSRCPALPCPVPPCSCSMGTAPGQLSCFRQRSTCILGAPMGDSYIPHTERVSAIKTLREITGPIPWSLLLLVFFSIGSSHRPEERPH